MYCCRPIGGCQKLRWLATNGYTSWPNLQAEQSVAIPKCNVPGTPTPSRPHALTPSRNHAAGWAPVEANVGRGWRWLRVLVLTGDYRLP